MAYKYSTKKRPTYSSMITPGASSLGAIGKDKKRPTYSSMITPGASSLGAIDPGFAFTPGPQSIDPGFQSPSNQSDFTSDPGFANSSAQREGFNESNYISKEFGSPGLFPTDPSATSPAKDQFIANKTRDITNPAFQETSTSGDNLQRVIQEQIDSGVNPYASDRTGPSLQDLQANNIYSGGPNTPGGATVNPDGTYTEPPKSATDKAFESYLASLQPSSELKTARKNLAFLTGQGQQAIEKARRSGKTLDFAAGEASRVGRDVNLAVSAAAENLQALTDIGASRGEIGKARYDYEQAKLDQARQDAQFDRQQSRLEDQPFTLGPGQSRFEKGGEEIASLPPTPKATDAEKPLSDDLVDIQRIEDLYGFVPPLGATMSQITQFLNDNPGATDTELQAGIDQMFSGEQAVSNPPQFTSAKQYFSSLSTEVLKGFSDEAGTSKILRGKAGDIDAMFAKLEEKIPDLTQKIQDAVDNGFSPEDILKFLIDTFIK
jgi:hypothetical protein